MTWGQLTQQAIYDFTADESYRLTQQRSITLPPEVAPAQIATAVRNVLERHESLRTLFSADRRQRVQASAGLLVPVAAESDEQAKRVYTELYRRPFGPDDLPVRFAVLNRADGSTTLLVAASHLAVDAFSADRLAEELRQLCRSQDPGALAAVVGQPVDRIVFEASPAGTAMSRRNIDRWLRLREEGVSSTPPPGRPGLNPRFHIGKLVSPRLRRELPIASARLGVSPGVVLLAGMSNALADLFGISRVAVRVAFSNRANPQDQGIETLMQWGLAIVDVHASAAQLARSAFRETMRASATARYDIYDLFETLSGERYASDQRFMPQAFLNYFSGGDTRLKPLDDDTAVPESTFSTSPSHERDSDSLYFLYAEPSATAITAFYIFDSRLLSSSDLEESAWALERWVTAAARSDR